MRVSRLSKHCYTPNRTIAKSMASKQQPSRTDSPEYLERKAFFDQLITVYGRKPVLEILQDHSLKIFRVHLADSNRNGGIIDDIKRLAQSRNIEVCLHRQRPGPVCCCAICAIAVHGYADRLLYLATGPAALFHQ